MKKDLLPLAMLSIILMFGTGHVRTARAQPVTTVSILPAEVTINEPGQTATVDLNVTNVERLYGYEVKIFYRRNIVNATRVDRPPGHFLEPTVPGRLFEVLWEIKNDFNETHGRIFLALTLLAPESSRSGSGILARITFLGLNVGTTPVVVADVILADDTTPFPQPIPHITRDGTIIVIPEFPAEALLMAFLIATIAIGVVAKKNFYKKHKLQVAISPV